jgi:Tfp pilus assembly protein PilF
MVQPRLTRISALFGCLAALAMLPAGALTPVAPAQTQPGVPAPYRAAYQPTDDGEVLQEVAPAADPAVAKMRLLRAAQGAEPRSVQAALQLANAYIAYGRQIGDAHYAGYAEAVIAPWTGLALPPAGALLAQATILQYRHQWREARSVLQRTLRIDARNGQAWLTLATLDMVQGDYTVAARDCAQVTNDAGIELGLACLANVRSYTGEAHQSLALLHQAEAAGGGASADYRAWIEGLIAESAERLGDWSLAETHYRAALTLLPEDNFLLVAYADFLLDRGRPREVLTLLAAHTQSDTAFLRLSLAQAAVHSPDAARYAWIMAARFAALAQRGSEYFGREQARFALLLQHDPAGALALARSNWQMQRAPWDARVVLEAALAARRPDAALAVVDFLDATKLEDPIISPLSRQVRAQLPAASAAPAISPGGAP